MKNCPMCNAELNDDVVFCTECGETLEVVETAPEAEVVENAPKAEVITEAPKKNKVPFILGIVGIALIALYTVLYLIGSIIPYIGFLITFGAGFFSFAALVVSIIGIVLSVKEKKATGEKKSLVINIIALVLSILIPIVLPIVVTLVGLVIGLLGFGIVVGMDGMGGDFIEIFEEILWELGLY